METNKPQKKCIVCKDILGPYKRNRCDKIACKRYRKDRARKRNKCKVCNEIMPAKRAKYCSDECSIDAKKERARKSVLKQCELCPRSFYNDKSGRQRFCTHCKKTGMLKTRKISKWYQKKYPTLHRTCLWCNKYFICTRKDKLYCEAQCTRHHLRAKKNGSKSRPDGTCKLCKGPTKLKRHHSCDHCGAGKPRKQTGNAWWKSLED